MPASEFLSALTKIMNRTCIPLCSCSLRAERPDGWTHGTSALLISRTSSREIDIAHDLFLAAPLRVLVIEPPAVAPTVSTGSAPAAAVTQSAGPGCQSPAGSRRSPYAPWESVRRYRSP